MSEELVSQIVLSLVGALLTIITATIVPALNKLIAAKVAEASARLELAEGESGIQIRWAIKSILRDAVRIAEQAGVNGVIQAVGAQKKAYAIKWAKDQLEQAGLGYLPVNEIAEMMEAAYREVFHELTLTMTGDSDYLPEV